MKLFTSGLGVRFLRVMTAIGRGIEGNFTGRTLSEKNSALKRSATSERVVTKRPVASRWCRTCWEYVTTVGWGTARPALRKISTENRLRKSSDGSAIQGSSTNVGEVDLPAARQRVCRACDHARVIVEERRHREVVGVEGLDQARQRQIGIALAQVAKARGDIVLDDMEDDARTFAGEPIDDRRQKPAGERLRTGDPDLADRRIGQMLDLADALFQLVEGGAAAAQHGLAVGGRRYAMRTAIEQPRTKGVLQIGDGFGYRRLGHAEPCGRPGHAARLHDGKEDVQIAQPQAAADARTPTFWCP